jgi:hypothetical protein
MVESSIAESQSEKIAGPLVARSQAMHSVLECLTWQHALQLQIVCKKWYSVLIPMHFSQGACIPIPNDIKFVTIVSKTVTSPTEADS